MSALLGSLARPPRGGEAGSRRATANRLGISSSAVSQATRRLEEECGRSLIRRSSRRLEFTPDGLALMERARAIAAILDETAARFGGGARGGAVKLGLNEGLATAVLAEALAAVRDRGPVRLEVVCGHTAVLDRMIETGGQDAAVVVRGVGDPAPIGTETWWRDPMEWAARDLAVVGARPVPAVLRVGRSVSAAVACAALRRWAGSWRVAATCRGWGAVLTAVRAGFGATPLPVTVVPDDLVAVPPTILPPPGDIEVQEVLVRRALAPWLAAVRAAAEVVRASRAGARAASSVIG